MRLHKTRQGLRQVKPPKLRRFSEACLGGPAIKAHNGKVLVRNPSPDHREGGAQGLAIVIEFESIDAARAFYESDAYAEARAVREKISDTDLVLVEGL